MQINHVVPQQNRQQVIALSLIFIILNALDAQITIMAVGNGAIELNPIIRILLTQSAWLFWLFKIAYPSIFAALLLIVYKKHPQPVTRILTVLVIVTTLVCVHNLMGVVL